MKLTILYEDNDIIACEKLSGIPVQSDRSMDMDLVNALRNYRHENEPDREPYIGLVHRLDRPVGGVMVFGKTPFATKELNKQIQNRQVKKTYLCVVTKDLSEQLGKDKVLLTDYLKKDAKNNRSMVVPETDKNGKKAQLYYQVKKVENGLSLLEVELLTGRHHQIRVQMAAHLAPLWGDTKYNPQAKEEKGWKQIALFSNSFTFTHPKTKKSMTVSLEPSGGIWDMVGSAPEHCKL